MKAKSTRLLIQALHFALAFGAAAQDLPQSWLDSGFWFANSNDSFGQGLPLENDDFHSYGFAAGWNFQRSGVALYWDIYTFRGSVPTEIDRTDRLLALYAVRQDFTAAGFALSLSESAGLYVDGDLGGLFVQQTFHHLFSDYRPIPGRDSYDPYSSGLMLGVQGSAFWTPSCFRLGFSGSLQSYVPLMLAGDFSLQAGIAEGGQSLLAGLRWESPVASFYSGGPGDSAWQTARDYTQGLRVTGIVRDGPIFYEFEYHTEQKSGDGIIGFLWTSRKHERPLWSGLDTGLMVYRMRAEGNFEEMAYCRIRLLPFGMIPGSFFAEARNGGLYMDLESNVEVRIWSAGAGYEYSHELAVSGKVHINPFARALVFFGANRVLGCTGYRGEMRYDTQNLGIGAALGARILGAEVYGDGEAGIELGFFAELPLFAFNAPSDAPHLIQSLRLGFIIGISSGT